jgi:hypothetical protein
MTMSGSRHETLFDIHPVTGASFEVFYADRRLESFGRRGAGCYWRFRRRGFAPNGPALGPFPTSFAAYRSAVNTLGEFQSHGAS